MEQHPATSPFTKTELVPIAPGDTYSKKGAITGLQMSDGKVLLNFEQSTAYGFLKQMAGLLNAEIITVKGTWTFTPETDDSNDDTD